MDLLMDAAILTAAQCTFGHLQVMQLLLCISLVRACTLLALALGASFAAWLHLPLLLLCAQMLSVSKRLASILQSAACILCYCAAAAGFCMAGGWVLAVLGVGLLAVLVRRGRHIHHRWDIEVELALGGVCACFPALIDTGNRLKEHKSGLPVLIVEEGAAGRLAAAAAALPDDKKCTLPYGVLGGTGEICCFQCDEIHMVLLGVGKMAAPPCRVAIYPGRIPGSTCALAPPEFAEAAAQASTIQRIQERARRVFYGIFKRKAIDLRFGGADSQGFGLLHRRQ